MNHIKNNTVQALYRRLLPLYIAVFFQGFVFWYTVEKLFMRSIGFDDAGIGNMIAAYSVVMLLVETPSGVLADRWSRKGVLVLASLALASSALIGANSHAQITYIMAAMVWGVFFALYSGAYDSMVYDTVYEMTGNSKLFEKFLGRVKFMDSSALVAGSLLGGLIATRYGLRAPYLLTIPSALVAIIALSFFKEPTLHKSEVSVPVIKHIRATFAAVLRNKDIAIVMIVLITSSTISYTLLEFSQVWLLALSVPVGLYGLANASLLTSIGLGGALASRFKIYRFRVLLGTLGLMLFSACSLVFSRNAWIIVASQIVLSTSLIGLNVVFSRMLHDSLPSAVRAGSASAVSTITRLFVIPMAVLLGYLSRQFNVFSASSIFVILAVIVTFFALQEARKNNNTGLHPK